MKILQLLSKLDICVEINSCVLRMWRFFSMALLRSARFILSPFLVYHIFNTDNNSLFDVLIIFFSKYFFSVRDFEMRTIYPSYPLFCILPKFNNIFTFNVNMLNGFYVDIIIWSRRTKVCILITVLTTFYNM